MSSIRKKVKTIIHDNTGSEAIEFVYSAFFLCIIIIVSISILSYAVQANAVSYAAKRITRYVEVSGSAQQNNLDELLPKFLGNADEINASVEIADVSDWYDASAKKIQLRGKFSIVVRADYTLPLMDGVILQLPIRAKILGQSEIYWK